jgi:hypothetical protein
MPPAAMQCIHANYGTKGIREISHLQKKKNVCSNRSNKNSKFFPMYFDEVLSQELRRFLRSFCQVLRSFLQMFFRILYLKLIVMSKSSKVPSKFFETFPIFLRSLSNIPSKFFEPFFEVLRNFCRKPSNLSEKIIFKLYSNYRKIPCFF